MASAHTSTARAERLLPLLVLRPQPGHAATISAARALGLDATGEPLFAIAPVPWQVPGPHGFAGLLAGSANVFRHGGSGLAALRALPVHAVGATTAEAAREAGFTVAQTGAGGLQPLVERLPPARYLRLAGAEHVALSPPHGVGIETRVVYAARALPLSGALAERLSRPTVILLHSGEAARHFAAECTRCGINRSTLALACLAPRIGEAAGPGWQDVAIAPTRTDDALLALARQMCQRV